MTPIRSSRSIVLIVGAAACSGTTAHNSVETPDPAPSSHAATEALFRARQDSARMRFTDADVRFMTGMIMHHAQALIMADLAPSHDAGPQIMVLTSRIINAQQDEILTMQNWLRSRGEPAPEVEINGLELTMHGPGMHGELMPGMLTQEQLEELDAARGEDFDRLFLRYMIMHHQGAITMVDDLFDTDGAGQDELAFKLASDIYADQTTEINRMQLMLSEMTPDGGGR